MPSPNIYETNHASLHNDKWVGCWVCGNPLIQGNRYPYIYTAHPTVTEKPWNPELHPNRYYAICCSVQCFDMAYIALM